MPEYQHCGLYFTEEQIQAAHANRDREPLQQAWAVLLQSEPTGWLAAIQWDGLRYRLNEDLAAGERAVQALTMVDFTFPAAATFDKLARLLALAQSYELVRSHPAFGPEAQLRWQQEFAVGVKALNAVRDELAYVDRLWLAALKIAGAIVLERDDWFDQGAECYRQIVRDDIRPEGYLPPAVSGGDAGSLSRQLLAVAALALAAEMAAHVGVDLWGYMSRGVSLNTACTYLVFYYYYPEKWRWGQITEAEASLLFQQHGGFLEMVYRRTGAKDMRLLLDNLRPIYDLVGGGLTTLTHSVPTRRRLFR
ncbi:MAG TPA: alginate lyase family protein [Phototrophicaceae bacterium]|nr:alginate lyase family protein [Phototrophicaceae bacterium]